MNTQIYYFLFLAGFDDRLKQLIQTQAVFNKRHYLRYLYVIHRLLEQRAFDEETYYSYGIPLCWNKLEKKLSLKRGQLSVLMRNLSRWQIIDKVQEKRPGRCKRYQLNMALDTLPVTLLPISGAEAKFIRNFIEEETKNIEGDWLLQNQYDILRNRVKLNDTGLRYLRRNYPIDEIQSLIENYESGHKLSIEEQASIFRKIKINPVDISLFGFLTGRIYVSRPDKESRVYSNLANLKREFRTFLHLDGKPLLMTDISNSQVLFSIPMMKHALNLPINHGVTLKERYLHRYVQAAESGTFFETLMAMAEPVLKNIDRSTLKKMFWREVFFGKVRSKGKLKGIFKKHYRDVAKIINKLKAGDYTRFPVQLQRQEASVMIDTVLTDMVRKGMIALSLHDSIVVVSELDREYAERLITKTMQQRYWLTPHFKHE